MKRDERNQRPEEWIFEYFEDDFRREFEDDPENAIRDALSSLRDLCGLCDETELDFAKLATAAGEDDLNNEGKVE